MKKVSTLLLSLISGLILSAQTQVKADDIEFILDGSSIQSIKLSSDTNSSSFAILIKDKVKAHYHDYHTESIYVQSGTAEMQMGDSTFSISKGDFLVLPPKTIHAVKVTSSEPLKVISIQAPEFLGKDRHFINED
ncbi:MAG: cupin domain-containing protein [Vicingaceae bacterium]